MADWSAMTPHGRARRPLPGLAAVVFALVPLWSLPVAAQSVPTGWTAYANTALGYTIAYPPGWSMDAARESPGPDGNIAGVAFGIPAGLAAGTNLSAALTGVTVDHVEGSGACNARRFLQDPEGLHDVVDRSRTWSVATMTDAGAGHFYEMTVYALKDHTPCLAVRYVIHSTNIANYEPGAVKPFDRRALVGTFDAIRETLTPR